MFDISVVLSNLFEPMTLLLMALSACFGIIMGAIPGLSGTLGIALLMPFTFGLEPGVALLMLGSVYCGSEYGGSIPSILINTPGTAAALSALADDVRLIFLPLLGWCSIAFAVILVFIPPAELDMGGYGFYLAKLLGGAILAVGLAEWIYHRAQRRNALEAAQKAQQSK